MGIRALVVLSVHMYRMNQIPLSNLMSLDKACRGNQWDNGVGV